MQKTAPIIGRGSRRPPDSLANAEHIVFGALVLYFLIKEPQGLPKLWNRFTSWIDANRLSAMRLRTTGGSK